MASHAPVAAAPKPKDYLSEDNTIPGGYRFALVSFVGPTLRQKNDKFGMKIRGCFVTSDEASAHAELLQATDGIVDIFMVEMGKWALVPPDVKDMQIGDIKYQEEYLNTLMKGYVESHEKAKATFSQRNQDVLADGIDKHLLPDEILPKPEAP